VGSRMDGVGRPRVAWSDTGQRIETNASCDDDLKPVKSFNLLLKFLQKVAV
jgi:hypothetical protein